MSAIATVYMKDLRSYFSSLIAYIIIAVFLIICGFFFFNLVAYFGIMSMQAMQSPYFQGALNLTEAILTPLLMNASVVMLFMIPILTMRSFSEEKKSGTIELLYTYPLTDFQIVMGKFFAVSTVFLVMIMPLMLYPYLVSLVGGILEIKTYFTGMLGLAFMGLSFIAVGVFVSAFTENQIISVVVSFGILLLLWVVGWVSDFTQKQLGEFLNNISIIEHYKNFALGVIDTQDILFYVLFIAFFLYFTLRVIESRNWRG